MRKQISIFLVIILTVTAYQARSQTVNEFGNAIYEIYQNDITQLYRYYISKQELKTTIARNSFEKINTRQLNKYLNYTIEKQEEYIDLSKYDLKVHFDDFKWKKSTIDSITFDIIFPKPGNDSIIKWKSSENFNFQTESEFYVLDIFVYANNEKK